MINKDGGNIPFGSLLSFITDSCEHFNYNDFAMDFQDEDKKFRFVYVTIRHITRQLQKNMGFDDIELQPNVFFKKLEKFLRREMKKLVLKDPSLTYNHRKLVNLIIQKFMVFGEKRGIRISPKELNEECLRLKEVGNVYFNERKFEDAINKYNETIKIAMEDVKNEYDLYSGLSVLFSNRAICYGKIGKHYSAICDTQTSQLCVTIKQFSFDFLKRIHQSCFKRYFGNCVRMSNILVRERNTINGYRILKKAFEFSEANNIFTKEVREKYRDLYYDLGERIREVVRNSDNTFRGGSEDEDTRMFLKVSDINVKEVKGFEKLEDVHYYSISKVGNELFIFGGTNNHSELSNRMFKVDLKNMKVMQVKQRGKIPCPRHRHMTVFVEEKDHLKKGKRKKFLYLLGGGAYQSDFEKRYKIFLRFNLFTNSWQELPGMKGITEITHQSMHVYQKKKKGYWEPRIIVYGGMIVLRKSRKKTETSDVWEFNPKTLKWMKLYSFKLNGFSTCPTPRVRSCSFILGRNLVVFGGEIERDGDVFKKISGSDFSSDEEWVKKYPKLKESNALQDCWMFSLKSRKWKRVIQIGNLPTGRGECFPVVIGSRAYFFGGFAFLGIIGNFLLKKNKPYDTSPKTHEFFKDSYEFSICPSENVTNEVLDVSSGIVSTVGCWRKVLFPENLYDHQKLSERSNVYMFEYPKGVISFFGGFVVAHIGKKESAMSFNDDVYSIRFEKECWKRCQRCFRYCESTKKCSVCRTYYCSAECQKKDWKIHKEFCSKV